MRVVSVVGKADSFELTLSYYGGEEWRCTVPPDVSDGKYVCEFHATNDAGDTAHWTGVLYMLDSKLVGITFDAEPFGIWLDQPRFKCELSNDRICILVPEVVE